MFRAWSKIVIAGLLFLGVDAFASDSNQRSDQSYESNRNASHQSLPTVLDNYGYQWPPLQTGINTIQPEINTACRDFIHLTPPVSNLLKYPSSSPRAPPSPAR